MNEPAVAELTVEEADAGRRLDAFLADRLEGLSRSVIKRAMDAGSVSVNGAPAKPAYRLDLGDTVSVGAIQRPTYAPAPEPIPLEIVYEDDDMVAVNKRAGMVVHQAKGHFAGTLAAALAHHFGDRLSSVGGPARPGIVHRLDRETSGVIVVAKHDAAHERLSAQFADRTTEKEYFAIVLGSPDRDADVVDEPIGPHPRNREKMSIRRDGNNARPAVTAFEVVERFRRGALVKALPKTGRTHQIRLHLAFAGHPVLCDKLYGGRSRITETELRGGLFHPDEPALLDRHALHAHRLRIDHPVTGERLSLEAPLPVDLLRVLEVLRGG